MKTLTEFQLADGRTILVESTDGSADIGVKPVGANEFLQRAKDSFNDAIDKLRPAMDQLVERLTELKKCPSEMEIEFGIKLSAAAGAIIAATGTEANFKVKLSWRGKT
ncbi:MAG: CU044_2847 family protein [Silvibacterium sp.]